MNERKTEIEYLQMKVQVMAMLFLHVEQDFPEKLIKVPCSGRIQEEFSMIYFL
jgi:hypothetical protein